MNLKSTLVAAAVAGMSMGAVACASQPQAMDPSAAGMAPAKHDCKGKNSCKGQGGCKTDANACKGQNACSGKGGCKTT
jgi:hypothetical protein